MIRGDGLFGPSLTTPEMAAAVSDRAWLTALLRFETELARTQAELGLISAEEAAAVVGVCTPDRFDGDRLGQEAIRSANPVVPLVLALKAALGSDRAGAVHLGATSQDALDTATMLISQRALALIRTDLDALAGCCAGLAEAHRSTVMAGRTLMQQAVPITFGLKAAGWLTALVDARHRLASYQSHRLAVQFGGAAGNLSGLGDRGLEVRAGLAARLGLQEPVISWHSDRSRIVELAAVLAQAGGAAGKIALDILLLSQTEVGEVAEAAPGGSSAMAHKQNSVASIEADACVRGLMGQVSVLTNSQRVEHERAAGAWQAEWPAVTGALLLAAGAVARSREAVTGLRVDPERMRANLGPDLAPGSHPGATDALIDRALAHHRKEIS